MANPSTWMTDNMSQLSGKTLKQIVFFGTHDSGMSELHGTKANILAQGYCTKTQTLDIHDQVVLAGARYLDVRPSYYEADALSDVPSGNYTAHWSDMSGSHSWVGLIGRSVSNVCSDLLSAVAPTDGTAQLGANELILVEISHGAYLKEALPQSDLSQGDQNAIIQTFIDQLGDYLYKATDLSLDPFSRTLGDIFSGGTTGPLILLWSSSSSFSQCTYTAADGFFLGSSLGYYNTWGDANTSDSTTLINDLRASLQKNLSTNPFFLLCWHITGGPGTDLSDEAAVLNPLFQDTIANWFSTNIISANALPSIVASDFVSNDTGQLLDVCVAVNYGQYTGLESPNTQSQSSLVTPSLVELNGQLYLAWTGTDSKLNVSCSTDGGASFGTPFTSEKAIGGPSLCVRGTDLYIAWTGTDNKLNIAQVTISGSTVTGFTRQVTWDQKSMLAPSLASFNGNLYIAWTGVHDYNLYVAYAPNGGMSFANPLTPTQRSAQPPSLTVSNGNLLIVWGGASSSDLYVAQVALNDDAPSSLVNVVVLPSNVAGLAINAQCPSIVSVNGVLYLAWADATTYQLTMLSSTDNGQTFADPYVSSQLASAIQPPSAGPSLCVSGQTLYFAWPDNGNNELNVAEFNVGT